MIVGIVGGIASGKSTVSKLFREFGCETLDADEIAHEALSETEIREAITKSFAKVLADERVGQERPEAAILRDDGEIDRQALARLVFPCKENVKKLNEIVHPWVHRRILEIIEAHQNRHSGVGAESVLVLDVSLLSSSPLLEKCDAVLFVHADREIRLKRAEGRGWEANELDRREVHQPSTEEKRGLSRWTVNNTGFLEETRDQVRDILTEIGALKS